MSFDALTLAAVRDELEPLLVEARIQKLVLADELTLAIEAFAPSVGRTCVLFSGDAEQGRVQRISRLPSRGLETDTPFSLLVRKHLRNARIRTVHQPRLERVFELHCEQRDVSGAVDRVVLIVEAMGRRSNLVLVDEDGSILDAARRSPPSRNPRRPVLPHLPYSAPPPQDRWFPEQVSAEALAIAARDVSGSLARFLSDRLAGLSPLAGREIAFRAVGAVDALVASADWDRVAATAREFVGVADTHAWQPTLALADDGRVEYAPYVLSHLEASGARLERFPSISRAIEEYYARAGESARTPRGDPLAAERKALLAPLERASRTAERRIAALEHQLETGRGQRDDLRIAGEALLAHQAEVPVGASQVELDGRQIELDSRASAVENAQAYFARYRKARETEERVPALLEEARNTRAYLEELRAMVEVADQMDAIRALRREVGAATGAARDSRKAAGTHKSAPYRRVNVADGWEALIGTSAAGNALVTFDLARADDLWLHARGVAGAHVILRADGSRGVPDNVLERAAQLAAWNSAARSASAVEVDVAQRRYVKKIAGAQPGLVRYSNERTVRVKPSA